MARRRFLLLLVALTVFALGVRLAVTWKFQGFDAPPDAESNPDQLDYEGFGRSLAEGDGYALRPGVPTARRPPGTSVTLVPPYLIFGHSFCAARIWFNVLSAATVLCTGLLGAALFGEFVGLIAALGLALYPGHFYYAMHFLSEVPYGLAIALVCLLAVTSMRRPSWKLDLLTGLLFGFAILTRPQVAFAGPLAFAAALLAPRALRAARIRQVAIVAVACVAVVLPWIARNQFVMGKATLATVGGVTFWGAHNPVITADPDNSGAWMPVDTLIDADHPLPDDEVAKDGAAWRYGIDFVRTHVDQMPRILAQKVVRHFAAFRPTRNRAVYWSFALAWIVAAPLIVVGLFLGWRRAREGTVLLLCPILSTFVTALIFYGSIRFRDADAPLFIVPAAAAAALLLPARWRRRFAAPEPTH